MPKLHLKKKNPKKFLIKNFSKLTISITNQHLRSYFTMNYQRPSHQLQKYMIRAQLMLASETLAAETVD